MEVSNDVLRDQVLHMQLQSKRGLDTARSNSTSSKDDTYVEGRRYRHDACSEPPLSR